MMGVHGEKLSALLENKKLPESDRKRVKEALKVYGKWKRELLAVKSSTLEGLISGLVDVLNRYKFYIDVYLIFDSNEDFLYRQKGQLKLDNTVMEEFLPVLVRRCIEHEHKNCDLEITSQPEIFSTAYFASSLNTLGKAGGFTIRTKAHDFAVSRRVYLKSSYFADFRPAETSTLTTNLGYILAELKTNLDKTMFQEASATAHDVKQAVPSAKYYLLCDFLDMTPISTATTDIDEILITRKAKRISANIRSNYTTYAGRIKGRTQYISFLRDNPYSPEIFSRFVEHVLRQMDSESINESDVLNSGYF